MVRTGMPAGQVVRASSADRKAARPASAGGTSKGARATARRSNNSSSDGLRQTRSGIIGLE
jgi:hypothetical protein